MNNFNVNPISGPNSPEILLPTDLPKVAGERAEGFQANDSKSGVNSLSSVSSRAELITKFAEIAIGMNVCKKMDENEKKRKQRKKEIQAS